MRESLIKLIFFTSIILGMKNNNKTNKILMKIYFTVQLFFHLFFSVFVIRYFEVTLQKHQQDQTLKIQFGPNSYNSHTLPQRNLLEKVKERLDLLSSLTDLDAPTRRITQITDNTGVGTDDDVVNLSQLSMPYQVLQINQNKTFLYTPQDRSNYILVEINVLEQVGSQGDSALLLLIRDNVAAAYEQSDSSSVNIRATKGDLNGYYLNKYYLNILVQPEMMDSTLDKWVITLIAKQSSISQYQVTVTESSTIMCPNRCNTPIGGDCNSDGKCACSQGRIDQDCSAFGKEITFESSQNFQISANSWVYAIFNPSEKKGDFANYEFQIRKSSDEILSLYVTITGNTKSFVPNKLDYSTTQYLIAKEERLLIVQDSLYDKLGAPRRTIFGILSEQINPQNIVVSINKYSVEQSSFDGNLLIVYFLLGIAAVLFIVWIILTIIRIRYERQQEQLEANQGNQPGGAQNRRNRRKKESKAQLTIEIIEEYMPSKGCKIFLNEQEKLVMREESCSVCLVEFDVTDMVRETICNHIFHKECLEQWLKQHQNCPMCRTGLSKKELEDWRQARHEAKEMEQQPGEHTEINHMLIVQEEQKLGEDHPSSSSPFRNGGPRSNSVRREINVDSFSFNPLANSQVVRINSNLPSQNMQNNLIPQDNNQGMDNANNPNLINIQNNNNINNPPANQIPSSDSNQIPNRIATANAANNRRPDSIFNQIENDLN